jgi:hypothetical protein
MCQGDKWRCTLKENAAWLEFLSSDTEDDRKNIELLILENVSIQVHILE